MRRLAALVLTLIILFTTGIVAAIGVGSAYPASPDRLFTNPDGTACEKPCLFGIRPMVTTLHDAAKLLDTHPFVRDTLRLSAKDSQPLIDDGFYIGHDNISINIEGSENTDKVAYVNYSSDDPSFTLGQLLLTLGDPVNISMGEFIIGRSYPRHVNWNVYLIYPDKGISIMFIYASTESMQLSDHPALLYTSPSDAAPDLGSLTDCEAPYCKKWAGLKSIQIYIADLPLD